MLKIILSIEICFEVCLSSSIGERRFAFDIGKRDGEIYHVD